MDLSFSGSPAEATSRSKWREVNPGDRACPSRVTTWSCGVRVVLPLVGRSIPVVADAYSDPEKGSGAVKITPAHDFNDFAVGRRHGLD